MFGNNKRTILKSTAKARRSSENRPSYLCIHNYIRYNLYIKLSHNLLKFLVVREDNNLFKPIFFVIIMFYESIASAYSSALDVIDNISSGLFSAFSPSYAFAGMPQSRDNSRGLDLSGIVNYMGRNRFHKDHENPQHIRQQAPEVIPVAKTRGQREHVPNSVVGEDGEKHHINRYESKAKPVELTSEDLVRETLKAIEKTYKG